MYIEIGRVAYNSHKADFDSPFISIVFVAKKVQLHYVREVTGAIIKHNLNRKQLKYSCGVAQRGEK